MDVIDLDTTGAVRHERCAPCGGTWWLLADGRWALVARKSSSSSPPSAQAAVCWGTEEFVDDGPFAQKRRATGATRYAAAELFDDPRPHLEGHARADWLAAHPLTGELYPVAGPPVADVLRELEHARVVPILDQTGELVIGAPGRAYQPLSPGLQARVAEYAALIGAHVAGKPVPCVVAKCKEPADRIGWPARPICVTHSVAVVRPAALPEFAVELPEPWPFETKHGRSNAQVTGELIAELRQRRPYAPPGALTRR